jgi:FlgD Ig-like domain
MHRSPAHRAGFMITVAILLAIPATVFAWPHDPTVNVPLCVAPGAQTSPTIASDGADGAIVVWQDSRNGSDDDIYIQRVSQGGVPLWQTDGVAVCISAGSQAYPTITSDGAGGAIVTWMDFRSGSPAIYAQRYDAYGAAKWSIGGAPVCTVAGGEFFPVVASDGAGGAIFAWEDFRGFDPDIFVQRLDAAGTLKWTTTGVPMCTQAGTQDAPTIVADQAGGAIVTWEDHRTGTNYDVYAQRVNGTGAAQWAADGVALCTALGDQAAPQITTDGASGAIVVWEDYRSGTSYDIFAQRLDAAGLRQWGDDGVALCVAANSQDLPAITSNGAGGAVVAWEDYRNGTDYDVYAQFVNAAGAAQWAADGVALSIAAGSQANPKIAPDGLGGAVVAWEDARLGAGNTDIFAQLVSAAGAVQWAADGAAVCTASGSQVQPAIVRSGIADAIVAWSDGRAAASDIYAQRIVAAETGVATGPLAPRLSLGSMSPNPVRSQSQLRFSLAHAAQVDLAIYDAQGRRVRALVSGALDAGEHLATWDARDEAGGRVAAGVYFMRLAAGGEALHGRVVVLN